MYHIDLTEIEWQYITKVSNLQARKRKYNLRRTWDIIFIGQKPATYDIYFFMIFLNGL